MFASLSARRMFAIALVISGRIWCWTRGITDAPCLKL